MMYCCYLVTDNAPKYIGTARKHLYCMLYELKKYTFACSAF
jgi:hypothetical protein